MSSDPSFSGRATQRNLTHRAQVAGPGCPPLQGLIGKNWRQAEHPAVGELVKSFPDVRSVAGPRNQKGQLREPKVQSDSTLWFYVPACEVTQRSGSTVWGYRGEGPQVPLSLALKLSVQPILVRDVHYGRF